MGLDMSVYRITKPNMDDSVVYDIRDIDGVILTEDDLEHPMYRDLTPYVQQIQIRERHYDMAKIREDYGLSKDSYISDLSNYGISVTDENPRKTVEIASRDVEQKYATESVEKRFVCKNEEEKYWRKAYDVQEWFHEHIGATVENTGFYILSGELLLKFNKAFPHDKIAAEEPDEESALFYWEWY